MTVRFISSDLRALVPFRRALSDINAAQAQNCRCRPRRAAMSSKAFTIRVFTWLHQVNHDLELLAVDVCVALQLVIHFNEDDSDGRAWPSCKTLGEAIGLSEATVIHSVRRLHARGHLRVIWGQPGSEPSKPILDGNQTLPG